MQTLSTYIRENAPLLSGEQEISAPRADCQSALEVLVNRNPNNDGGVLSLLQVSLNGIGVGVSMMDGWVFESSSLVASNFRGASLNDAHFGRADIRNAVWIVVSLKDAYLSDANLERAFLYEVNLEQAALANVNLAQARIYKSDFKNAHMPKADLSDSMISETDFSGVWATEAVFESAKLTKVDFSNSNLNGANFANSDFKSVELEGCSLKAADLSGLSGLSEDVFGTFVIDEATVLPAGFEERKKELIAENRESIDLLEREINRRRAQDKTPRPMITHLPRFPSPLTPQDDRSSGITSDCSPLVNST
jgi:uncharacterized protein YjbI with pentapeptide repeats